MDVLVAKGKITGAVRRKVEKSGYNISCWGKLEKVVKTILSSEMKIWKFLSCLLK